MLGPVCIAQSHFHLKLRKWQLIIVFDLDLSHQLALMMILKTWASLSTHCSSPPEPLVHCAPNGTLALMIIS
jgi:hypothetical protein